MKQIETKYAVIRYDDDAVLDRFIKNIIPFSFKNWLARSTPSRVDKICKRVQRVLGIRSLQFTVTIRLFADRKTFIAGYNRLYGKTSRKVPRLLYEFYHKVIYVNVEDIDEGMLAHEFTHPILHEYFKETPPRVLSEVLARHVEKHLHDKVKKY